VPSGGGGRAQRKAEAKTQAMNRLSRTTPDSETRTNNNNLYLHYSVRMQV